MKRNLKRITSLFLVLCMSLSFIPTQVFAADPPPSEISSGPFTLLVSRGALIGVDHACEGAEVSISVDSATEVSDGSISVQCSICSEESTVTIPKMSDDFFELSLGDNASEQFNGQVQDVRVIPSDADQGNFKCSDLIDRDAIFSSGEIKDAGTYTFSYRPDLADTGKTYPLYSLEDGVYEIKSISYTVSPYEIDCSQFSGISNPVVYDPIFYKLLDITAKGPTGEDVYLRASMSFLDYTISPGSEDPVFTKGDVCQSIDSPGIYYIDFNLSQSGSDVVQNYTLINNESQLFYVLPEKLYHMYVKDDVTSDFYYEPLFTNDYHKDPSVITTIDGVPIYSGSKYNSNLWEITLDPESDVTSTAGNKSVSLYAKRTDHDESEAPLLLAENQPLEVQKRKVLSASNYESIIVGTLGMPFSDVEDLLPSTIKVQASIQEAGLIHPNKNYVFDNIPVTWIDPESTYDPNEKDCQTFVGEIDISSVSDELENPDELSAYTGLVLLDRSRRPDLWVAPPEPEVESVSSTKINFKDVNAGIDLDTTDPKQIVINDWYTIEIGIYVQFEDGTKDYLWSTSRHFEGLKPDSTYQFAVRYRGTPFFDAPSPFKDYEPFYVKTAQNDEGQPELEAPTVSVTADKESVVWGEDAITLTANASHSDPQVELKYQWFKDSEAITGATKSTLEISDVSESGTYVCQVTANNHLIEKSIVSNSVSVTIEKAVPTVSGITAGDLVYGDKLQDSYLSFTDSSTPGTITWAEGYLAPSVADSNKTEFSVIFTPSDKTHYKEAVLTTTVKVSPAQLRISVNNQTVPVLVDLNDEFGSIKNYENYIKVSGLKNGDLTNILKGTLVLSSDAFEQDLNTLGSFVLSGSGLTADNYDITFVDGTLQIVPAEVTITPRPSQQKVFGSDDPEYEYDLTVKDIMFPEAGLEKYSFYEGLKLTRESGEDVGDYAYIVSHTNKNFVVSLETGSPKFHISPLNVEAVWQNIDKEYISNNTDQSNSVMAYYLDVLGNQVYLSLTFTKDGVPTVFMEPGEYTVTANFATPLKNYTLSNNVKTITMGGREVSTGVTFPTVEPLLAGNSLSDAVLSGGNHGQDGKGTYAWEDAEITPDSVGPHTYKMIFTPSKNDNTDYSKEPGYDSYNNTIKRDVEVVVIAKKLVDLDSLTVEKTKTYDGTKKFNVKYDLLKDSQDDVLLVVFAETDSPTAGPDKPIRVTFEASGSDLWMYDVPEDIVYTDGEIFPAELIVTVKDATVKYGDSIPLGESTISGFVNNESIHNLSGSLSYDFNYKQWEDIPDSGVTTIEAYGLISLNYQIDYKPGTLTILKKDLFITPNKGQMKYYGADDPVYTYSIVGSSYIPDGLNIPIYRDSGEEPGFYAWNLDPISTERNFFIQMDPTLDRSNPDYPFFEIKPAKVEVVWTGLDDEYVYTGSDLSDSISASYKTLEGEMVRAEISFLKDGAPSEFIEPGTYTVVATPIDSHYIFSNGTKLVSIYRNDSGGEKKDAIDLSKIKVETEKVYDGTTHVNIDYENAIIVDPNDKVEVVNESEYDSADAGSRIIHLRFKVYGEDANKYNVTVGGDVSGAIKKAPLVVSVNDEVITYGDPVPSFTYDVEGFVTGESLLTLGGTKKIVFDCDYKQFDDVPRGLSVPVSVASFDIEAPNYDIFYENGSLYVRAKGLYLDWAGLIGLVEDGSDLSGKVSASFVDLKTSERIQVPVRITQDGLPVDLIRAGTYDLTALVDDYVTNYYFENIYQTVVVAKSDGELEQREIDPPKTKEVTTTSVELVSVFGAEYSIDDGKTWQDEPLFTGLTPGTEYFFVQRYKETDTEPVGKTSAAISVRTLSDDPDGEIRDIQDPKLLKATKDSISLIPVAGAEYSIDNGKTWQDDNMFSGLKSNTEYTFVQRYKETADLPAGNISNPASFKTEKDDSIRIIVDPKLKEAGQDFIELVTVIGAEYSINGGDTWQDSPVFTGLKADTEYSFVQRYKATSDLPVGAVSKEGIFRTLKKDDPVDPGEDLRPIEDPKIMDFSSTSITLRPISGAEYSMDNGTNWQNSNVFSGLTPNTAYTFVQRYAATSELPAGKISNPATFKTLPDSGGEIPEREIADPKLESASESTITLVMVPGAEYSMDGGRSWQSSNVFAGLDADTSYTFLQRYAKTETEPAGKISNPVSFRTTAAPVYEGVKFDFKSEKIIYDESVLEVFLSNDFAPESKLRSGDPVTPGSKLYCRNKTTGTEETIIVPERAAAPDLKIDFKDVVLPITSNMEYSLDDGQTWKVPGIRSTEYLLALNDYFGKTIQVRYMASDSAFSGTPAVIKIPNLSAAPSVSAVDASTNEAKDGAITGVGPHMEYSFNGIDWVSCSGTTISGLAAGTYYVRVAATTTSFASEMAIVKVNVKDPSDPDGGEGGNGEDGNGNENSGHSQAGGNGMSGNTRPEHPLVPGPGNGGTGSGTIVDNGDRFCPSDKFVDVDRSDWYHDAVDYTAINNFMLGVSGDHWDPNGTMTRVMLIQVLYRIVGSPDGYEISKTDVTKDDWYYDAVAWAYAKGITGGISANEFGANEKLTYQQMATMIYRFCNTYGLPMITGSMTTTVSDQNEVADYAENAMQAIATTGIMNVNGSTTVAANDTMTRAEAAQVITNFCSAYSSQMTSNTNIQGPTMGIYTNPGVITTSGVMLS